MGRVGGGWHRFNFENVRQHSVSVSSVDENEPKNNLASERALLNKHFSLDPYVEFNLRIFLLSSSPPFSPSLSPSPSLSLSHFRISPNSPIPSITN